VTKKSYTPAIAVASSSSRACEPPFFAGYQDLGDGGRFRIWQDSVHVTHEIPPQRN
jgi:hypothetical protein